MIEEYISIDVEADGPVPGLYSMVSFGAYHIRSGRHFYSELRPISDQWVPEALAVSGFTREQCINEFEDPAYTMKIFEEWLSEWKRPIMVGFNGPFDWQFINYYFHKFRGKNPLGISCIDIKALYMGHKGCLWKETAKSRMEKKYLPGGHTHNALDDAKEQAEIFTRIYKDVQCL